MRISGRFCALLVTLLLCVACGGSPAPHGPRAAPQDSDNPVTRHCTRDAREIPGSQVNYQRNLHTPRLGVLVLYRSAKCGAVWAKFRRVHAPATVSVTVKRGRDSASTGFVPAIPGEGLNSPMLLVHSGQCISGEVTESGYGTAFTRCG